MEPTPEADGADSASSAPAALASSELSVSRSEEDPGLGVSVDVPRLSRDEIAQIVMGGFQGPIKRPWKTFQYGWGILLNVAVLLLLLLPPAIAAAFAYFSSADLILSHDVFGNVRDQPHSAVWLVYLLTGLAATVSFVVMLRLFATTPGEKEPTYNVSPDSEPLLWEFVNRIADTVGVGHPGRIEISCEVSARISVVTHRWDFAAGPTLVLGLPLATVMDVRQFAGVVAHEMGHRSQGAGLRLTYATSRFKVGMASPFYACDLMDHWLRETNGGTKPAVVRVRAFRITATHVFFVLLGTLAWIPALVCAYLKRQMEFDADQYDVRLSGNETFERSSRLWPALFAVHQNVIDDIDRRRREGRLPDDFLRTFAGSLEALKPEVRSRAENDYFAAKTLSADLHPCYGERLAAAKRTNAPGTYQCDLPASVLFQDLEGIARAVTRDFYRNRFGDSSPTTELVAADKLLAEQALEQKRREATRSFCLGTDVRSRSIPVEKAGSANSAPLSTLVEEIKAVRNAMQDAVSSYSANVESWGAAISNAWTGGTAELLINSGVLVLPESLKGFDKKPQLARASAEDGQAQAKQLLPELRIFETSVGRRWQKAVEILAHPELRQSVPDAIDKLERAKKVMRLLAVLDRTLDERMDLFHHYRASKMLIPYVEMMAVFAPAWRTLYERLEHAKAACAALLKRFEACEYPFDHNRPGLTVAEYLTPFQDMTRTDKKLLDGVWELQLACWDLADRATDYMCELTLEVESALGLPPVPQVVTKDKEGDDNSEAASQAA